MPSLVVKHMGCVDYSAWLEYQSRSLRLRQDEKIGDTLFLAEHPEVYTLGRSTHIQNDILTGYDIRNSLINGVPAVRISRGGGVMFHNRGQIVGYPILRLRGRLSCIRHFLYLLEGIIIDTLAEFKIAGFRRPDVHPGVFTQKGKIGFMGITISKRVVSHGFAINVVNDLDPFKYIAPCGLRDVTVCSVNQMTKEIERVDEFKQVLEHRFVLTMSKEI